MRVSCLINNYNYRRFVGEAVDSVLAQRRPVDEVIVVDDGSTDGSVEFLRSSYALTPNLRVVAKPNGGQLSAFKEGVREATGDLICFLDADDYYLPHHTEHAVEVFRSTEADVFTSAWQTVDAGGAPHRKQPLSDQPLRDAGRSLIHVLLSERCVGGPTSALTMRRAIAESVLEYPHDDDWRLCADAVLMVGSSLVNARKFFFGPQSICYRIHGDNGFVHNKGGGCVVHGRLVALHRLVGWFAEQRGLNARRLAKHLHYEFRTIRKPTFRELRHYLQTWRDTGLSARVRTWQLLDMLSHFRREHRRRAGAGVERITSHDTAPALTVFGADDAGQGRLAEPPLGSALEPSETGSQRRAA